MSSVVMGNLLAAVVVAVAVVAMLWVYARGRRTTTVAALEPVYRSRYFFPPETTVRRTRDFKQHLKLPRPARLLVYMQFDTNKGYERYTVAINRQYCAANGYRFVLVDADKYADVPPYWRKVFLLRDLLQDPSLCADHDYVMWMDSDAAFTGTEKIDRLLHEDPSLAVHVGMDAGIAKSAKFRVENRWANAGVFLVRCNEIGRRFAETWLRSFDPSMWCKRGADLRDLTCRKRELEWTHVVGVAPDKNPQSAWSTASRWSWDNYEQNMMTATMRRPEFVRHSCVYEWEYMSCPDPGCALYVLHMYAKSTATRTRVFRAQWALLLNAREPMRAFTA